MNRKSSGCLGRILLIGILTVLPYWIFTNPDQVSDFLSAATCDWTGEDISCQDLIEKIRPALYVIRLALLLGLLHWVWLMIDILLFQKEDKRHRLGIVLTGGTTGTLLYRKERKKRKKSL